MAREVAGGEVAAAKRRMRWRRTGVPSEAMAGACGAWASAVREENVKREAKAYLGKASTLLPGFEFDAALITSADFETSLPSILAVHCSKNFLRSTTTMFAFLPWVQIIQHFQQAVNVKRLAVQPLLLRI